MEQLETKSSAGPLTLFTDIEYTTKIKQCPIQGRMCGLGEKVSKRMLDPPLVLEVQVAENTFSRPSASKNLDQHKIMESLSPMDEKNIIMESLALQMICVATLYDPYANEDLGFVIPMKGSKATSLLLGTTIKSPKYMQSIEGDIRLLFVLSDLAIRIKGEFQIRCQVINMKTCVSFHQHRVF
jgi:hypothetical protein